MNRLPSAAAAFAAVAAAVLVALSPIGGALVQELSGAAAKGTCDEAAPAPAAPPPEVQDRLQALHDRFADLPGFVDVYIMPDRDPEHRAVFVGEVPDAAWQVETPVPVAMRTIAELPEPAPTVRASQPSTADIFCSDGIRPGAMLDSGCTLAFIYTNTTDGDTDYYATTAGHCISEGSMATIPGIGTFGKAVFSTGPGGPGDDYAVIEVSEIFESQVDGEMCSVGGPTGQNEDPILGETILHTGYGQGVGFPADNQLPPRPRTGVGTIWGAQTFAWYGAGIPGDSGSAVRLQSGETLGVLTHLGGTLFGTNVGTTWVSGMAKADNDPDVPSDLTLVTGPVEV